MTDFNTPIALFVYNRPEHTRRTLEALSRNQGSDKSTLFIFSDGLKTSASVDDESRLVEVRKLIREKPWCGDVEIIESVCNKGLAKSICEGISSVLEKYERVIVLEDDLETSPSFLQYMNDALSLYREDERVFQVSGFMVRNRPWASRTGFLRVSTSWGWGTWSRAWKHYRSDAVNLLEEVENKGRARFDLDGFSFHFDELKRNATGELNTWAVRWYASLFLQDGLCLYPRKTLVRNLGFDGSGVNCHDDNTRYHKKLPLSKAAHVKRCDILENSTYLSAMQSHFRQLKALWTKTRFRDKIAKKFLIQ